MIANLKVEEQRQHKNGGGWVALTARVDDSVYVGKYTLVYGQAELTGKVRVEDLAQVSGHVKLSGNVVVSGNYWLDHGTYKGSEHFRKNDRPRVEQRRIR